MRHIILVCRTNRDGRQRLYDAGVDDAEQQRIVVVTDGNQAFRALGLAPADTRWIDLGGSDLTEEAKMSLNARYTAAASLNAAIAWLRMEEKATLA